MSAFDGEPQGPNVYLLLGHPYLSLPVYERYTQALARLGKLYLVSSNPYALSTLPTGSDPNPYFVDPRYPKLSKSQVRLLEPAEFRNFTELNFAQRVFRFSRLLKAYRCLPKPDWILTTSDLSEAYIWLRHLYPQGRGFIIQSAFFAPTPRPPSKVRRVLSWLTEKIFGVPMLLHQTGWGSVCRGDQVLLWSKPFCKLGTWFESKSVHTIGYPLFSGNLETGRRPRTKDPPVVAVATTPYESYCAPPSLEKVKRLYRELLELEKAGRIRLMFRLHPRQERDVLLESLETPPPPESYLQGSLEDFLDQADLLVSVISQTAVEAMLRGIPVCLVRLKEFHPEPHFPPGSYREVHTAMEVLESLKHPVRPTNESLLEYYPPGIEADEFYELLRRS